MTLYTNLTLTRGNRRGKLDTTQESSKPQQNNLTASMKYNSPPSQRPLNAVDISSSLARNMAGRSSHCTQIYTIPPPTECWLSTWNGINWHNANSQTLELHKVHGRAPQMCRESPQIGKYLNSQGSYYPYSWLKIPPHSDVIPVVSSKWRALCHPSILTKEMIIP